MLAACHRLVLSWQAMPRSIALAYTITWALLCGAAIVVMLSESRSYVLLSRAYWRYLSAPWKIVSFGIAFGFFLIVAPYTGDPTWDRVDASFMSLLTFATAPWSVGTLYRVAQRKLPARQAFVASCAALLSASWSYDLYVFLRDGFYPRSWFGNLIASSVLYAAAGLMWNLAHVPGRGVIFGFMDDAWPALRTGAGQGRVAVYAVLFMVLVAAMMAPFVWSYLPLP